MVIGGNQEPHPPPEANGGRSEMDLFRLAARWRAGSEWESIVAELESERIPSHLNTINSSGLFHIVSPDKMSVTYVGNQLHGHDVGVVQADCPAPTRRTAYYFEMTVKNAGVRGQIAIGFTQQQFKMRQQPGWEENSCGYHGVDGLLYRGQGKGEKYGPKFTSGDTIGAGINYSSEEFFFTKNGEFLGAISKDIKGPLYPTIAVHSQNEEVSVNFGEQPFRFDIQTFILEERQKKQMAIEKLSLPANVSHWIVRSYLLHYGYKNTLSSFDTASQNTCPPISIAQENGIDEQGSLYALDHRNSLRLLILGGYIDSAFHKLQEWYPQVLQDNTSMIHFLLHSQRFIEYVRAEQLEDAVNYARDALAKFFAFKQFTRLLEDIVALLAYENPLESCVGYLLSASQRELVADAVNAVVLSTNPEIKDADCCLQSCLEKLLRQLTLCCLERRALNGNQGEAFYLHNVVRVAERARPC